MTFDSIELSAYDSSPVELYTFTRGSEIWRFTNADSDVITLLGTFIAIPITRSAVESTVEMSRNPITITVVSSCLMLEPFKSSPPSDITLVSISKTHSGTNEAMVTWLGRISNLKFLESEAEITCEPTYTSMKRSALRRRYQTGCPHVLYSTSCGVNGADFLSVSNIVGSSGLSVTSAAFGTFADGYFSGGYIEVVLSGILFRRDINNHVGGVITINLPLPTDIGVVVVRAFPGCDHSLATCHSKFSNESNFGGQPFYRTKNPMNGTQIY